MVVAAIGTVFAAGYLLWMLQKVAFGVPKPEFADAHIHDVSTFEWIAWLPILLLIVVLGVFPNIIFHVTDAPVSCKTAAPFSKDPPVTNIKDCATANLAVRADARSSEADLFSAATAAPDAGIRLARVRARGRPRGDHRGRAARRPDPPGPGVVADVAASPRSACCSARSIPVATLAHDRRERPLMFGGAYVVDHYALALKGFFIVAAYVTILLSVDYINAGDYYQGEFYFLLLCRRSA